MPKKQLLYSLLIILITILILFLVASNDGLYSDSKESGSSISLLTLIDGKNEKGEKSTIINNNFAVNDTASITKIFIADRSGATITLDRIDDNWVADNKYDVPRIRMSTILNAIRQLEIQRYVPKNAFETVVKNLATTGVKVEIYSDGKTPIKSYTIGNPTEDHKGNYMLLSDAESPSIVHIPSLNGFPSASYGIVGQKLEALDEWRATTVLKLNSTKIKSIAINHIQKPEQSFRLNTQPMTLFNYKGVKVSLNQKKALQLLNSFKLLNCENYNDDKEKLLFATPLHELIVNTDTLRTYDIDGLTEKTKDNNFNVKRMYATLNNGELMLIQNYVFNKVLITISQLQ